jgi:hypothetical protein
MLRERVRLSTLILVTIGLFDLVTSLLLISRGFGEANPIFSWLLRFGSPAFAIGKAVMLAGPILVLEYVRSKDPRKGDAGTWIAVVLYAALYVSHIVRMRG